MRYKSNISYFARCFMRKNVVIIYLVVAVKLDQSIMLKKYKKWLNNKEKKILKKYYWD